MGPNLENLLYKWCMQISLDIQVLYLGYLQCFAYNNDRDSVKDFTDSTILYSFTSI